MKGSLLAGSAEGHADVWWWCKELVVVGAGLCQWCWAPAMSWAAALQCSVPQGRMGRQHGGGNLENSWPQDQVESWGHLPCITQQMKLEWLLQEVSGRISHARLAAVPCGGRHICGSWADWCLWLPLLGGDVCLCSPASIQGSAEPPCPAALCPLVGEGAKEELAVISQPLWRTGP